MPIKCPICLEIVKCGEDKFDGCSKCQNFFHIECIEIWKKISNADCICKKGKNKPQHQLTEYEKFLEYQFSK